MGKMLERIILKFITKYNQFIPNEQFEFRTHHSTTHQLYRLCKYIDSNMKYSKHTACVFLDVEKAFDTVWIQGLLMKLITDIPDNYVHIINSFLTDRTFKAKVNKCFSPENFIQMGVPQGAVLSSTFLICIHLIFPDIKTVILHNMPMISAINIQTAYETLQNYLSELEKWLKDWKIKINPNKSSVVIFPFT